MSVGSISPADAKRALETGGAVLVDVRNADEFARIRIPGARLVPAGDLAPAGFERERASGKTVIFHCKSGARTAANATKIEALGLADARILEGGLDAWCGCGLPSAADADAPLEIMRQVQIAAGSLVLLGVALSLLVSPWFLALSAFVGAGLAFAGATGFCGMARLLAMMPWNARVTT
jgi:rhodanese-related sulfurtransferase